MPETPKLPLSATGIAGLDDVLSGGLPPHHLYLLEGSPGSGTTTLSLQYLLEGARRGENGVYVTLSETKEELDSVAANVIGGISIAGGIGSVLGAVLGALFLGVIKNALPVIGISPFAQMAISGTVIVLAVVFNARAEARKGRIILRDRSATEQSKEAAA